MKGKRRLHHESLESRRLLAADCQPLQVEETFAAEPLPVATAAEGESIDEGQHFLPDWAPLSIFHDLSHGPDLIHEEGNKLFVVDQAPYAFAGGSLFVYERTSSGTLDTVAEVELEFPVERMIVQGDQVLLFGNNFNWFVVADHTAGIPQFSASRQASPESELGNVDQVSVAELPQTVAVTVNLGEEVEVIRQEFEGLYHQIHHEDERIVMVSSIGNDAVIAIYPPPLVTGLVTTFDITGDGLRAVASTEVPLFGLTSVQGRDFYSANTQHSHVVYFTPAGDEGGADEGGADEGGDSSADDANAAGVRAPDVPLPPTVSVSRYALGDESIDVLADLKLGPGFLMHFEVSPDGLTAVAVRSEYNGAGPVTSIDLLDLSADSVSVFESIQLTGFTGQVLVAGPEHVVLRSYEDNTLVMIDANQSIDVDSESRVRRLELPDDVSIDHESLQVSSDRLVLRAHRHIDTDRPNDGVAAGEHHLRFAPPPHHNTVLLTVSIAEARILAETDFPDELVVPHESLVLIDSESERFGLLVQNLTASGVPGETRLLYGRLGESGEFQRDDSIEVGRWLEIDANADRLIAREADRLLEYDWENPDQPQSTPLGDPEPSIEAIDDEFVIHTDGEDHLLEVLANDVIHRFDFGRPAEIVEIAGAPEGAEIVDGHLIRIPAAALEGVDSLRFEYVISNGEERSSAVVEIEVQSISEEQVEELIEAVRERAAEDFGVSADEIEIRYVERIFTEPLPVVLPGEPEIDLSPGILVTLKAPNGSALYAASLEGEIIQILANQREALVELGLRAMDSEGNTLETVTEGENFWLEFNAKDLRQFGLGVYAAFFDLIVPTENLVVTGPIEYGPGFTSIPGSDFDEGEIDDLGAIGSEVDPPGNERQQILRIAMRAVSAGEVSLQLEPADARGTETLIRGRETELPASRVRYTALDLTIVEAADGGHLDADGNGEVSAADALVVINFLGRFGTTDLDSLEATVSGVGAEGEQSDSDKLLAMRRYDTTGNGTISSLDALVIINGLTRLALVNDVAEAEDDDDLIEMAPPDDGLESGRLF